MISGLMSDAIHNMRRLASQGINPADDLPSLLMDVVSTGAEALGVWRVNVWIIDEFEPNSVSCVADSEWLEGERRESLTVTNTHCPRYLDAIAEGRTVVVNDAQGESLKSEFLEDYLKPLQISACVDAVILRNNIPIGTLSCERKGGRYSWSDEEVMYVEIMADCCARRLFIQQQFIHQQRLEEDLQLLQLLIKTIPHLVTYKDSEGVFRLCNPSFCEVMGHTPEEVIGHRTFDVYDERRARDASKMDAEAIQLQCGEVLKVRDWLVNKKTSQRYYMEILKTPVYINGVQNGLLTLATDLTDWKRSEQENSELSNRVNKEREVLLRLMEASPDLLAYKTLEGVFLECNHHYCEFLNLDKKDVIGRSHFDVLDRNYHGMVRRLHQQALLLARGAINKSYTWMEHHKTKEKVFMEAIQILTYDESDQPNGVLNVFHDLTEWKKNQEDLERLATTDALTGLYNRRYLLDSAVTEINRAVRHKESIALIMFDIDYFKRFNDSFGHDAGDEVLKRIANTLLEELRIIDVFSRHGGEEFLIMLPNTTIKKGLEIAERLRHALEAMAFVFDGKPLGVTASFGVAEVDLSEDIKKTIKYADLAVYAAKDAGRNCSRIYEC